MSDIRKTSAPSGAPAVVYDLAKERAERAAVSNTAHPNRDSSGISASARELSRARAAVESADDVRQERIQALREQIARGEYNPDPREVAKKILERGL